MATVPDPDLEIGGEEGGGVVSKTFLRPFGPQFGLKIRGGGSPPGSVTGQDSYRQGTCLNKSFKNHGLGFVPCKCKAVKARVREYRIILFLTTLKCSQLKYSIYSLYIGTHMVVAKNIM